MGFKVENTMCIFLSATENDPELYLYGSLIPFVDDFKFRGLVFDFIKYLIANCLKALNLLKVLSHTNRGADRTVLLHLSISNSLKVRLRILCIWNN